MLISISQKLKEQAKGITVPQEETATPVLWAGADEAVAVRQSLRKHVIILDSTGHETDWERSSRNAELCYITGARPQSGLTHKYPYPVYFLFDIEVVGPKKGAVSYLYNRLLYKFRERLVLTIPVALWEGAPDVNIPVTVLQEPSMMRIQNDHKQRGFNARLRLSVRGWVLPEAADAAVMKTWYNFAASTFKFSTFCYTQDFDTDTPQDTETLTVEG